MAPGSKPEITEDSPCMRTCCMLNHTLGIERSPAGVVRKSGDRVTSRVGWVGCTAPTGGRFANVYHLSCNKPHTRQIFNGITGLNLNLEPGTLQPQCRDLTSKPPRPCVHGSHSLNVLNKSSFKRKTSKKK
ncbi:hypothetical protein AVEN_15469-1 [Araneus ventricosus]|uniref:Uncharacterized protein n=1 Tax=Araneus ventricosus TaxID=182803 RepID=A0A4Y2EFN7_ARAVE|nr:hypothetical protein AVEN_15469-1 [Araneus ventricosus]